MKEIKKIEEFSFKIKKNILEMAYSAGINSSHFGGALSIVDVVSALFGHVMQIDYKDPMNEDRDRFILSKGHACLAYYAALCEIGYIDKKDLKTFEKNDSNLLGHPVRNEKIGIDFSTGSLGMGLSLGIGLAISFLKKSKQNKVFVVLGDGECNEGSVWEAIMAAPKFNLKNLYAIIDNNKYQQTGTNKEIMPNDNLLNKFKNFGWSAKKVNGHSIKEIHNYFETTKNINKPKALIANTIKGKGFSFSENNNEWHHAILTEKLYKKAVEELENENKRKKH